MQALGSHIGTKKHEILTPLAGLKL